MSTITINFTAAVMSLLIIESCTGSSKNNNKDTAISIAKIPGKAPHDPVNDIDKIFLLETVKSNNAEIEAAKMVGAISGNQGIKEYAALVITDNTAATAQLKNIASDFSLAITDSTAQSQPRQARDLLISSGKKFDREYINWQVKNHIKAISMYEQQVTGGHNKEIKKFVSSLLRDTRDQLNKAIALQRSFQ
jgi:predicted outer membrane protein